MSQNVQFSDFKLDRWTFSVLSPEELTITTFEHMVNFWSKVKIFKKFSDRCERIIFDQEMSQSVQFSDFKIDRLTFNMFPEELKNCKF